MHQSSRKKRIASGSGTDVATINKLLKQFKMMSEMMKKIEEEMGLVHEVYQLQPMQG